MTFNRISRWRFLQVTAYVWFASFFFGVNVLAAGVSAQFSNHPVIGSLENISLTYSGFQPVNVAIAVREGGSACANPLNCSSEFAFITVPKANLNQIMYRVMPLSKGRHLFTFAVLAINPVDGTIVKSPYYFINPRATDRESFVRVGQFQFDFDRAYQVGNFINGDPYVIAENGGVTLTKISPGPAVRDPDPWTQQASSGNRQQAYHSGVSYYAPLMALNYPTRISGESSVVAVEQGTVSGSKTLLRGAAVLTVLSAFPEADAFRLPYTKDWQSARSKRVYLYRQVDLSSLLRLPIPISAPDLSKSVADIERVWLGEVSGYEMRYLHPSDNMPDYGQDISAQLGEAGLQLLLNYPLAQKEELLIHYLQRGIDFFGMVEDGTQFWGDGGHNNGPGPLIVSAGWYLKDNKMRNVTVIPGSAFSEQDQTYDLGTFKKNWAGNRYLWRFRSSANHEERPVAQWSVNDCKDEKYRIANTSVTYPAHVLNMNLLGVLQNFNPSGAYQGYTERWMVENLLPYQSLKAGICGSSWTWGVNGKSSSSAFVDDLWRIHYQP